MPLSPLNLLLVALAAVQMSYLLWFPAHLIQELKLDVTSYTHHESQRGSTLRSTQITTFFVAPSLPVSFFSIPVHL